MKPVTEFITKIEDCNLFMRRLDLLGEGVTGNKYYKLKYNILKAKKNKSKGLITFGGPFSNHLYATALAGKINGFKTIGIVRGDEWSSKTNESSTLSSCIKNGMKLIFISRSLYKQKNSVYFWDLINFSSNMYYVIPEGGTNKLAVKGTSEIIHKNDFVYDSLCCPVATGGTIAGLIKSSNLNQNVVGFSSLNHKGLKNEVDNLIIPKKWNLVNNYTFGGYAKTKPELISFINKFKREHSIQLDPIYSGKMVFGIFDLIKTKKWFFGKNILIFHTGGIQSIHGFNQRQKKKGLSCILN